MSGKKAKASRQASRSSAPPVRSTPSQSSFWLSWKGGAVALAIVALVGASFILPGVFSSNGSANPHDGMAMGGAAQGEGLPAGTPVPSFKETDVETGRTITSKAVYPGKTLLFFSEGVMCQACFEQIKGLERVGSELSKRGIRLVSITPDSVGDLSQAVNQYGITTSMIADNDRNMSSAFNTLGKGMHGDTPGHAFVLVSHGKVLWYRDYWLPPTRSMYVKPGQILADMPA